VWRFPRVCGTFRRRRRAAVPGKATPQTADEVVERALLAASNPGDMVLDPFAGTGTVPLVAAAFRGEARGTAEQVARPEDRALALEALAHLSSKRAEDYDWWIKTGMALHHTDPSREMLDAW